MEFGLFRVILEIQMSAAIVGFGLFVDMLII